jgi:predicted MFS family arabinose efflux permease
MEIRVTTHADMASSMMNPPRAAGAARRSLVIGLTAFLTLVDLFAAQAILPTLAHHYHVPPAAMGVAVNASTLGMAIASLLVGLFSGRINRRLGILVSLTLLAVPTTLLAIAPDLMVFSLLRITQGLCMASAFTLMLAYLGEQCSAAETAGAIAAYVTGNVASNLVGRLISAGVTDHFGLATNFYLLATLNLCGAALVFITIDGTPRMQGAGTEMGSPLSAFLTHMRNRRLLAAFAIGFCILFAFIGTFSYVNFVLVRPPLHLAMMQVGLVYCVFLPAIFTTPLAGGRVRRHGAQRSIWASLGLAILGLPLLLVPMLACVLLGMVLIAAGTFFAQAVATGFVGQAATSDRGAASGLYLAAYFAGGLTGSVVLGQLFDGFGWPACVAGVAAALALACLLACGVTPPPHRAAAPGAHS